MKLKKFLNVLMLLMLLGSLLLVGCDKRSTDTPDAKIAAIYHSPTPLHAAVDVAGSEEGQQVHQIINAEVCVKVVDDNNNPLEDVEVKFKAVKSAIDRLAKSNSKGIATASYIVTKVALTDTITVEVGGESKTHIMHITEPNIMKITRMFADENEIYADGNITFSKIHVFVKDKNGFPVVKTPVKFRTNIGQMITNKETDSSGVAVTEFYDAGETGRARIIANIGDYGESDTVSAIFT